MILNKNTIKYDKHKIIKFHNKTFLKFYKMISLVKIILTLSVASIKVDQVVSAFDTVFNEADNTFSINLIDENLNSDFKIEHFINSDIQNRQTRETGSGSCSETEISYNNDCVATETYIVEMDVTECNIATIQEILDQTSNRDADTNGIIRYRVLSISGPECSTSISQALQNSRKKRAADDFVAEVRVDVVFQSSTTDNTTVLQDAIETGIKQTFDNLIDKGEMVADEIPKITFNTVTIPKVSYCQSESLNGCDAAATCQNIQYSNQEEFYICECNEGYLDKDASKPGTVCLHPCSSDVNPFNQQIDNLCTAETNGQCKNGKCKCNENYSGDFCEIFNNTVTEPPAQLTQERVSAASIAAIVLASIAILLMILLIIYFIRRSCIRNKRKKNYTSKPVLNNFNANNNIQQQYYIDNANMDPTIQEMQEPQKRGLTKKIHNLSNSIIKTSNQYNINDDDSFDSIIDMNGYEDTITLPQPTQINSKINHSTVKKSKNPATNYEINTKYKKRHDSGLQPNVSSQHDSKKQMHYL